jgi:hypothetical protein
MKQRNPLAVFFLPMVTFGIYSLVWEVKTKNEMNRLGADIPTAWLLIVPLANYYWLWKYCLGVEKTTNNTMSAVMAFVLLFLLGTIGMAIIQNEFNKLSTNPTPAGSPTSPGGAWQAPTTNNGTVGSPYAGQTPADNSFGGPVAPTIPIAPTIPVAATINPVVPIPITETAPTVFTPEQPVITSPPVVINPTNPGQPEETSQPVVISPTSPDQSTVIPSQTPSQV